MSLSVSHSLFLSLPFSPKTGLRAVTTLALLAALLPLPSAQAGSPPTYTFHALGTLGGANSSAAGVNNAGQVAGTADLADGTSHAFLSALSGGALHDLGTLGGTRSSAAGVNDAGQVVGDSETATPGLTHAFLSDPNGGALQDLNPGDADGEIKFVGINDAGQIAGNLLIHGFGFQPFLLEPNGQTIDLGTRDASRSAAGINNTGQVVGTSGDDGLGPASAFLSAPNGGALHDLGTLGGFESYGAGVNDSGQVTGYAETAQGNYHAFLSALSGGALHDLGTLGGTYSFGTGVSNAAQVVGGSYLADGTEHAFLFTGGLMLDLNSLLTNSASGFTLEEATGISNTGFITGDCTNAATGQNEAFLLTPNAGPVPEASTTVSLSLLLMLGMGGLAVTARRRKAQAGV